VLGARERSRRARHVGDYLHGLLDRDGVATGLAELAADPERRRRMGAAGRAAVEAGYDIDGIADQLVSWFAATAP
jgi:glycosyltransferase involved in cell wall biosynthesis